MAEQLIRLKQYKGKFFEEKTSQKGKRFLRVNVDGGDWCSVWDPGDIALIEKHGAGPYYGEVIVDGDFTNLSELKLAPATASQPAQASGAGASAASTAMSIDQWLDETARVALRMAEALAQALSLAAAKAVPAELQPVLLAETRSLVAQYWMSVRDHVVCPPTNTPAGSTATSPEPAPGASGGGCGPAVKAMEATIAACSDLLILEGIKEMIPTLGGASDGEKADLYALAYRRGLDLQPKG